MRRVESQLRGRAGALQALRQCFTGARDGDGRLVVVSGEAGIGKSALCDVFGSEVEQQGARVDWGRAWEAADAPPYFPVAPGLRALRVDAGGGRPSFEVWEGALSALAAASRAAPVVWIVEDLHAADVQTLDLLAFLARPIRALRVLIVATTRSHDSRLGEAALQRLARMARDGMELQLGPLDRDDVAALAAEHAGRALPAAVIGRLVALTGGNPLFVSECARMLQASKGELRIELPATVRHAILERVALLPAACRATLTTAAVVGREVSAVLLARVLGASPATVADELVPALRAGLIDALEPGRFSFRHVLVRDAIEEAASTSERVELHSRAARALAAEPDSTEVLVERARHALAGASPADTDRALELARTAADRLQAAGAFDRAYAMEQRIEQSRRAGVLPPAAPDERLALARLARQAGCYADALRLCDEVAAQARASRDAALLGRAAWVRGSELRPGVVDPALVATVDEAVTALSIHASPLLCRLRARLAAARQPSPDQEALFKAAREAIAQARTFDDESLMIDVLYFAGAVLVDSAPIDERMTVARELLERALRASDVEKTLRAYSRVAVDRVELGDFSGFDDDVERMLEISALAGQARHRWRPLLFSSMRALMIGHIRKSERLVVEASELAGLTDDPALGLSLAAHRLRRARLLHHDEETFAALGDYERSMQGIPRGDMVVKALRLGSWARMCDAASITAELQRLGAQNEVLWERGFHNFLAEAYALGGTEEQRRRARAAFTPYAERELVVSHVAMTYEGPARRLLGLLDASLGDVAAGEAALRRALSDAEARGHRPWVAQLCFDLATVLREASRRSEAQALFAEAAALAGELGMDGLFRRAGAEAAAGSDAPPPAAVPAASASLSMTSHGDVWRFEHVGKTFMVKDTRGMQLLARLVERPREEIHVLVLATDQDMALGETSAGETLDQRALHEYGRRLAEVAEDLSEAEANADLGRASKLAQEKELLEGELSRALGLGGRARQARSASERARVNVQRRLKDAISRIGQVAPDAGLYLSQAVRTGTYCCFRP